ncbi:MAG: exosortase/archaeosortase family protein [Chromatiaceae bacterium]|nr:exosortase/archaeosortase family protein [Gammaproteobacteria bacterium]MCP5428268.1 exosortase/archaeosortase family protein [Chromatiaceae bacterium]MCP5448788.1 exosortase/archaeosortase family protein [Chromatiaceae bacterium]
MQILTAEGKKETLDPPKRVQDRETKQQWLVWVVAILLGVLFAPTLLWLWDRWTLSVWNNGHGILITLVVSYLIWGELRKRIELPKSSNPWGFAILIPALLLHMLDTGINSQLLAAASLFIALPGLSLLFLGTERTKTILFPLSTLFLTLPIPLFLTESIHLLLRYIATDSVAWLLPFFGVPVYSTGTLLQIPNGSLQVADACSGFSTLYATITVAILTAYFCPAVQRRVLVLLIAVPLAIAVNIVRVLLLTLLVHWVGLDVLATSAHEISGLATFAVALPIVFWLGNPPAAAREK